VTTSLSRLVVACALAVAALAGATTAQELPDGKSSGTQGFDLSSASSLWALTGNRVWCAIDAKGDLCTYQYTTPTGGGGFWPVGPPAHNRYIFSSGLQVAGIVAPDGGPWARDTVGAFFFPRGRGSGQQVTDIYSSANPSDLAEWPTGANVRDAASYGAALAGRAAISREDSWVRYWDGPHLLYGRPHPMGILVEQRSLQFTYPAGNEDILYWVFTLTNITASDPSAYTGLDPAIRWEVTEIAGRWVQESESLLGVNLPAGGYRIDSLYVGLAMDADVGLASENHSTAILPFETSLTYKSGFYEPTWQYPLSIASEPFGPYPGFVGAALLETPRRQDGGPTDRLTLFSSTTGGGQFPEPRSVAQLWRYLSGNVATAEGDPLCTINPPKERRLCALVQSPSDTRFFQSTGPFSLGPGESATIVMAYVFAAAIASEIEPFVNTWGPSPSIPPAGSALVAGSDTLRVLERAAGWLSHSDVNGDGDLSPNEVQTVPRSFLHKVQVARAVVDNGFLLPSAPDAPEFFLVPGDNRVTIAWQRSATEATGDPYFTAASQTTSGLYDPNFRQHDVEGYRIYRGRRPDQMELIRQFDYAGTTFVDYTGMLDYGLNCAPELGVTEGCPSFPLTRELTGRLIQIPPGGRVLVGDAVAVLEADTMFAGLPPPASYGLGNTGVPFAFVDEQVENFYPYYYAVTAFDVNSIASGPSSLESQIVTKSVVPRRDASNLGSAVVTAGLYGRDRPLDQELQFTFDGSTGTFTGAPPPTGLLRVLSQELFAPSAARAGAVVELRVDSVIPSYYEGEYYLTLDIGGQTSALYLTDLPISSHDGYASIWPDATIPADPARAAAIGQAGLPHAGAASLSLEVEAVTPYSGDAEWHDQVDGSFWTSDGLTGLGGSRWFDGADETMHNPTGDAATVLRGQLTGVTTIWSPQPYVNAHNTLFRRNRQATWHAARQADVRFYWGSTPGTLDSVIDVTHNVPVPFNASTHLQAGWGFRDDIAGRSTTYTAADGVLTEYDFGHGPCYIARTSWSSPGCETRPFLQQATLQPVDVTADGVADGQGFALYFNHEFYIFRTSTLPANTVWTHRSYFGIVDGTPGAYTFIPKPANAAVPGIAARLTVEAPAGLTPVTTSDLERIHTVPDPFYVSNALQASPSERVLKFVNLPERAMIRIYSLNGVLVDVLEHRDPGLSGEATWDVRNRNGRLVASGVYFYHVETPDGAERIGRFTVVTGGNFGSVRR